jgi:hypothetical protein
MGADHLADSIFTTAGHTRQRETVRARELTGESKTSVKASHHTLTHPGQVESTECSDLTDKMPRELPKRFHGSH